MTGPSTSPEATGQEGRWLGLGAWQGLARDLLTSHGYDPDRYATIALDLEQEMAEAATDAGKQLMRERGLANTWDGLRPEEVLSDVSGGRYGTVVHRQRRMRGGCPVCHRSRALVRDRLAELRNPSPVSVPVWILPDHHWPATDQGPCPGSGQPPTPGSIERPSR